MILWAVRITGGFSTRFRLPFIKVTPAAVVWTDLFIFGRGGWGKIEEGWRRHLFCFNIYYSMLSHLQLLALLLRQMTENGEGKGCSEGYLRVRT